MTDYYKQLYTNKMDNHEEMDKFLECLFLKITAENFWNLGKKLNIQVNKAKENAWLSQYKKTFSKKHYVKIVQNQWEINNFKDSQGKKDGNLQKKTQLSSQQISQQKPYRPRGCRMILSKYWKIKTFTLEYSI